MEILHHYSDELTLVQILYINLYIVPFAMLFSIGKGTIYRLDIIICILSPFLY